MKLQHLLFLTLSLLLISCSNHKNSEAFIQKTTGRYLYNSDKVIKIYFEKNELYMEWLGSKHIKPLKLNDNMFFVKEMNEKIRFLTNPEDQKEYIVLVPKEKNSKIKFNYRKLDVNEKTAKEYLENNEFNKALESYLKIKSKDSLDIAIQENKFNSLGYKALRNKKYKTAIEIFTLNTKLYPNSANVYDSLAEAYMKSGDTINAILNYKKSLAIDSGNQRAKRILKKIDKKK
jgi:tetratricopeptide (TPR) repeat protein